MASGLARTFAVTTLAAPLRWAGCCANTGEEIVTIRGLTELAPRKQLIVEMYRPSDGRIARFPVRCRIDTPTELEYFKHGGVLNYVLRSLAAPERVAAE